MSDARPLRAMSLPPRLWCAGFGSWRRGRRLPRRQWARQCFRRPRRWPRRPHSRHRHLRGLRHAENRSKVRFCQENVFLKLESHVDLIGKPYYLISLMDYLWSVWRFCKVRYKWVSSVLYFCSKRDRKISFLDIFSTHSNIFSISLSRTFEYKLWSFKKTL